MRTMQASALRRYDIVYLTSRRWVITSDVRMDGAVAAFCTRSKEGSAWGVDQELRLPADFPVEIEHAWRWVGARCLVCKETYPYRMDVAIASDPRGICGSCDARVTARAFAGGRCST